MSRVSRSAQKQETACGIRSGIASNPKQRQKRNGGDLRRASIAKTNRRPATIAARFRCVFSRRC